MNTRTSFYLYEGGSVRCRCGNVVNFAEDLVEFIIPILDYSIEAWFNGRIITVTKYDTVETICDKFIWDRW